MSPACAVVLDAVTGRYGPVRAVDRVSLCAAPGEILVLLGPSGCGKTTTLRLIAGLEAPDEGTIAIDGVVVAAPGRMVPPEKRHIGLVFQHYALFPHLTVADNVAYGIAGRPEAAARAAELLAMVGLGPLGGRMPHELSGGQQQRVALARALAPRPAVLLLDEPFSNLDARLRTTVRAEVRDILKSSGTTAIFVTHDQDEALFVGDRIAVLNGGRLEQVASPEAVFHAPASRFVAEFMGHTRFLAATVVPRGLATALGTFPQALDLPIGSEVQVLVRPDDVVLMEAEAIEGAEGTIRQRVFQGMHQRYLVDLASGEQVECLAPHTLVLEPGRCVYVALAPGHALACFFEGRAVGCKNP